MTPFSSTMVPAVPLLLVLTSTLSQGVTWDNSSGDGLWSTAANWDGDVEPDLSTLAVFSQISSSSTITLAAGEQAAGIEFRANRGLTGGDLSLGAGGTIYSHEGMTFPTINSPISFAASLIKTGEGDLTLGGANTIPGGTVVSAGRLLVTNANALGAAGIATTVKAGASLEIRYSLDRPVTLEDGASLGGYGGGSSHGKLTIDPAAGSVTLYGLGVPSPFGSFTIGNAANDLTGGNSSTIIQVSGRRTGGPGVVELGASTNFTGTWNVNQGATLKVAAPGALGSQPSKSVSLSGGTLVVKANTSQGFTGSTGNRLVVSGESSLLTEITGGTGTINHNFGTLEIGTATLSTGRSGSSMGGEGVTFGLLSLKGDPTFYVASGSKLSFGSLNGGLTPRTITKSGPGTLSVTGGGTVLPPGSILSSSGSGVVEMLFPGLGSAAVVTPAPANVPFGNASLRHGGGTMQFLADGSGTNAAQTFVLPTPLEVSGNATVNLAPRTWPNQNKTFAFPSLTLAANSSLGINSERGYSMRVTGATTLEGSATLRSGGGLFTLALDGGIQGGPADALTIGYGGGLRLPVNVGSTYGGGTFLQGGEVILNVANALGAGPITMSNGSLDVPATGALGPGSLAIGGGAVTIGAPQAPRSSATSVSGGALALNSENSLGSGPLEINGGAVSLNAGNSVGGGPITLNGGTLDLKVVNSIGSSPFNMTGGSLMIGVPGAFPPRDLTVSGGSLRLHDPDLFKDHSLVIENGTLEIRGSNFNTPFAFRGLVFSGNSKVLGVSQAPIPRVEIAGTTRLAIQQGSTPLSILSTHLRGDLELNVPGFSTVTVASVTEDGLPRILSKSGSGTLELTGGNQHTGGTVVEEGALLLLHPAALGGGGLTLGATGGGAHSRVSFMQAPQNPPEILVRAGSSGLASIASNGPYDFTGGLVLERSVHLYGGTYSGVISGTGGINISPFDLHSFVELKNPANSFTGSVTVDNGVLRVRNDGGFGNPLNPVYLTGDNGVLTIDGTFTSGRSFVTNNSKALNEVGPRLMVNQGHTFTINGAWGGTGNFKTGGGGTLSFGPGVDSSARGTASTELGVATTRIHGVKNLSDAGLVGLSGRLEVLHDGSADFGHPLRLFDSTIFVDRAPGGSSMNGRHRFGQADVYGQLTLQSDHGYSVLFDGVKLLSYNCGIRNQTALPLVLDNLVGSPPISAPGSSFPSDSTATFECASDILIDGPLAQSPGTGVYGITKEGPGTLRFGSGISGFGGNLTVKAGLLDLNGAQYAVRRASITGDSTAGAGRIVTGPNGSLRINDSLLGHGEAVFTGHLILGGGNAHLGSFSGSSLVIDGPISGSAGSSILIGSQGNVRFTGAGNTQPGVVNVAGKLDLAKSSGTGVGIAGLTIGEAQSLLGGIVTVSGVDQIHDSAPVKLSGWGLTQLDLGGRTEKIGALSISQGGSSSLVSTGASGVLILNGDLSFSNNNTGPAVSSRNVLITGSGSHTTPSSDGTLDLGGVTRSIHVSTTTSGAREPLANATIETRIINGGIIKTGPRTLYLTNPNNSFSGGVEVRQGLLGFVNPGAWGTGPLTFTNATGVVAGIDLSNSGGVIPNSFAASASGDLSLVYGAPVPETLEVSGSVALQNGGLQVQVTNGTTGRDRTATLHLSGLISDGAGAQGLVKSGDGTLRLAAGNTYGGATTLKRGTLQIPDPSALGDGNLPLSIDGGCLTGTESFTMHRPVTFTANGGSLRSEAVGSIEFAGQMAWSSGTVASFGSGMTILSGGSTSGYANMLLGNPTVFASGTGVLESELGSGHVLSLRGASALPTGNLSFDRAAVLELGNADFIRGLGTGASQFQMPTSIGGGWAAYGANRSVNIGGASALVTWGQVSPAFLHKAGMIGSLHLGSASGTHTLVFRNDLELNHGGAPLQLCKLVVNDGPAALDAKLAGNLQVSDPARSATLEIDGPGTLEIGGNNHGAIAVVQKGTGTTRFTGQKFGAMTLERGAWIFGSHGSSMPTKLMVAAGTHLDASGLNEGVVVSETGELRLFGSVTGNVTAPRLFEGNGSISGSFQQVAGSFRPVAGGALFITGVFDLAADFTWEGAVPGDGYPQVKVDGKVILGNGSFGISGMTGLVSGQSHVVILNGGNAPISGAFANLPEGAIIPLPGGSHALKASYRMNGDGQAFGNDFGFTVVGGPGSSDRQISVSGPLAVSPGESFELNFALGNGGPETTSGNYFEGVVPVGSLFLGSTPAGTFDAPTTLRVPLADMAPGASATVTMHFQAAAQTGSLVTQGTFRGTTPGPQPTVSRAVAFLPGASLEIAATAISSDGENLDLTINSLPGVRYSLEGSTDLLEWETVEEFLGTGLQMTVDPPIAKEREFFRVRIVP